MRIAIFSDTFYPNVDGIVTATLSLAKGLANKGHQIIIVAPKNNSPTKEIRYKNIKVVRIPGISALFYPGFKITSPFTLKLVRMFRREKIEIIHFQTPATIGANAILLAKYFKLPLVGTFHTFMTHPEYRRHIGFQFKFLDKLSWAYARLFYSQCTLITSPSATTKEELIKYHFNKPIKVISNGIDLTRFNPEKRISKNLKNLLFIGRIAYEKNIFYLLDCFNLVLKKIPDATLTIVGNGPQIGELKRYIEKINISKSVILRGEIKHSDLINSRIFKESNIFVSASKTENQPMTILEAQANGLVSVVLNEMGMRDLVINNYNGYTIQDGNKRLFADTLIKLIRGPEKVQKLRENTLREIGKHDLKKVILHWEETYSSLIKK